QRIVWANKLDDQHLSELLIKCHILYNQVDKLLRSQLGCRLYCRSRCKFVMSIRLFFNNCKWIIIICIGRTSKYESPALGTNQLRITGIDGIQDNYQEQTCEYQGFSTCHTRSLLRL